MDYSQFLYMREELSLIAVLLLLFLADLFMSPDAHKNGGKARLNTMLPVILMAIHTAINLIPGTAADAFGGMYHYVPMHTVVKSILNVGTLIVFLMDEKRRYFIQARRILCTYTLYLVWYVPHDFRRTFPDVLHRTRNSFYSDGSIDCLR